MNFYTVRDLRTTPKSIWENLSADGEVIITNNGRPTASVCRLCGASPGNCPGGIGAPIWMGRRTAALRKR